MSDNILIEAHKLVTGDRAKQYGNANDLLSRVAGAFEIITGKGIEPEDICLIMVLLKLQRDQHRSKRDNRVDACGYLELMNQIKEK